MHASPKAVSLLGVRIACEGEKELADRLMLRLSRGERTVVYTPNPVMLARSARDSRFARTLQKADLCLPDGVGVSLGARLCGYGNVTRVTGIDMGMRMLAHASRQGYRVYLLGAERGVAARAATKLSRRFPSLKICGVSDGYFENEREVVERIRQKAPDILFVCLGSPRQEQFIERNAPLLPSVGLFMALGGSLDVWSGDKRRAPLFLQASGLEWLWRMAHEPKRMRDLPAIALFFGLLAAERGKCIVKLHSLGENFLDF